MPLEIPPDLRVQVDLARKIGGSLYLQDKASAIATNVMIANVPAAARGDLRGYYTMREGKAGQPGDAWLVFFFVTGDPPRLAYRVRVPMTPAEQPTFAVLDPPAPATGSARLIITARQTALAALSDHPQPLNPVILPGSVIGHNGILVYLIAGTAKPNVAVLGRHWRARISPDGKSVVSLDALSRSILEIPLDAAGEPTGTELSAIAVSHLVTDHPLETHVLASLAHQRAIHVSTSRGLWLVEGDTISLLQTASG